MVFDSAIITKIWKVIKVIFDFILHWLLKSSEIVVHHAWRWRWYPVVNYFEWSLVFITCYGGKSIIRSWVIKFNYLFLNAWCMIYWGSHSLQHWTYVYQRSLTHSCSILIRRISPRNIRPVKPRHHILLTFVISLECSLTLWVPRTFALDRVAHNIWKLIFKFIFWIKLFSSLRCLFQLSNSLLYLVHDFILEYVVISLYFLYVFQQICVPLFGYDV